MPKEQELPRVRAERDADESEMSSPEACVAGGLSPSHLHISLRSAGSQTHPCRSPQASSGDLAKPRLSLSWANPSLTVPEPDTVPSGP